MNLKDYSDLILTFVNKVDSMWNRFFAANAGIIVWLASIENDIPLIYRIFATVIYISYIVINLVSHVRAYKFLNLALKEFRLNIDNLSIQAEDIPRNIGKLKYDNRYFMVIVSYLIAVGFVNHILWTNGYKAL